MVKDLEWAKKLTDSFRNDLEEFLPEWIESLIPYYQEGKERGVDMFCISNFKPTGYGSELLFEHNGIAYYQTESLVKGLGFNVAGGYRKCNWWECFCERHPEHDTISLENFRFYHIPMHRLHNNSNGELAERVNRYFQSLTGDDKEAGLSLSSTSMIYFNERGKWYINKYCKMQ